MFAFADSAFAQDDSIADANAIQDQTLNFKMPKDIKISDYRFNVKVDASVPNPLSDKALKKSFLGTYSVVSTFNVNVYKGFFVGVGFENELLSTPFNKSIDFVMRMQMNNVIARIGYEQQVSDIVFFSYAFNVGWDWTKYTSVQLPSDSTSHKYVYNNLFLGPQISLYLLLEDHVAIGFNASLYAMNHTFDPNFVFLDSHFNYNPGDNQGISLFLNTGFTIYYGFHKKRH
ncbi:MAG: hypothetical protein ABI199_09650 [Bacteroidia bacterium]